MLEAISGLSTLAYLAVSGVIGFRLLSRGPGASGPAPRPERMLGLFFVLYSFIGSALNVCAYAGWSSASLALPDPVLRWLHGGFFWVGGVGVIALLLFVRRTFRPEAAWARVLASALGGSMLVAAVGAGVTEGYAVRVVNGWAYWLNFAARDLAFVWICWESLACGSRMQRRVRLGLAEPLVANRFLLIGAWGLCLSLVSWTDPIARIRYYLLTGSTVEWIPAVGQPLLMGGMAVASGLLSVATGALLLAFFPTRGYRRRVEGAARAELQG